ncbi:MAG: hypothetical protein HWQ42_34145 [Nostoc sp. JL23]|uniref:hypothetical protein n=1 Tax=Nostoc sp. TaxID=1180 RepID=UPI001DEC2FE9|nr:hypothetical protein [Nostoc sp. JL23]
MTLLLLKDEKDQKTERLWRLIAALLTVGTETAVKLDLVVSLIFRLDAETVIVTTTDSAFVPGNMRKR